MADPSSLRHLDPKVKWIWLFPQLGLLLILWLMVAAALFLFGAESPIVGLTRPMFMFVLLLFEAFFLAAPIYAYIHIEYMSFTYEFSGKEFIIRQGVFTRETTVIPYARIQNINTRRTLFERLVGLASLVIETAGTNPHESEGLLPGVANKDALIHELMDRVERAKSGRPSPGSEADDRPDERALLSDILKEIVQLKQLLQSSQASPRPADPLIGAPRHSPEAWTKHSLDPPSRANRTER